MITNHYTNLSENRKLCTKCKDTKPYSCFSPSKRTKCKLLSECKKCASDRVKAYRDKNYAVVFAKEKNRRVVNKEKYLQYNRNTRMRYIFKYRAKAVQNTQRLLKEDALFKFKFMTRVLVRNGFKNAVKGKFKKRSKTVDILGCGLDQFVVHIQSLFSPGMTLENHGKWHIDHIIPLSTAKTEEDVIRLNHYTNLQPLWAKDNLAKSNKISNHLQTEITWQKRL